MKTSIKTALILTMVFLLLAVSFIGCTKEDTTITKPEAKATEKPKENEPEVKEEATAELEDVVEVPSSGKLTVSIFDRGNMPESFGTPTDNRWVTFIKENFADVNGIEMEFYPIPRSQEKDMINVMMAARNAPDILMTYSLPLMQNYASLGGLARLNDAVEQFGQNYLATHQEVLNFGMYGPKDRVSMHAIRFSMAAQTSFVRKDWLDAIGYELTEYKGYPALYVEDLMDILMKFKEADPSGVGSENMYPLGMYNSTWWYDQMAGTFIDFDTVTEEDYACFPGFMLKGYKEGMRYLNELFLAGLVDPDYAIQADKMKHEEYIATGKTGFWSGESGTRWDQYYTPLYENEPDADLIPVSVINSDGVGFRRTTPGRKGMTIMIPAFSESVKEAVMYLDWLSIKENDFILRFGIEGEHFQYVDGVPQAIDVEYNKVTMFTGDYMLMYNGDPTVKNFEAKVRATFPEPIAQHYLDAIAMALIDAYTPYHFSIVVDSVTKYSSNLGDLEDELHIKTMMAPEGKFDEVYDSMTAEYLQIGGQEVIDDKKLMYSVLNNGTTKLLTEVKVVP